jgi:NAD(P)-dependent dehydrogenase (short-subunit alcohol dehydrogenase family)
LSSDRSDSRADGRTVLITGGGTGIGRAIATRFVADGKRCAIVGRREDPLQEVAQALGRDWVEVIVADVADASAHDGIVDACEQRFGPVDILVNNAGTNHHRAILDFSVEEWRRVFATNLEAAMFLSQRTLAGMRDSGFGRIVNIASVYGHLALDRRYYGERFPEETPGNRGPIRSPAYHSSKAGLLNLTRDLAVAAGPWGVTVNSVSPGMIGLEEKPFDEETRRRLVASTPLRRLGKPSEVAGLVAYLASDEAAFVTGADMIIDGGWTIW